MLIPQNASVDSFREKRHGCSWNFYEGSLRLPGGCSFQEADLNLNFWGRWVCDVCRVLRTWGVILIKVFERRIPRLSSSEAQ